MIMNTTTKVILGITVAAAAGAAIGMLIAPEKGSVLQHKIKESASTWLKDFAALLLSGQALATKLNTQAHNNLEETASEFKALAGKDHTAVKN